MSESTLIFSCSGDDWSVHKLTDEQGNLLIGFYTLKDMQLDWTVSVEDAERICLHILTDSRGMLTTRAWYSHGVFLVKRRWERTSWMIAHSSWSVNTLWHERKDLPVYMRIERNLGNYEKYLKKVDQWSDQNKYGEISTSPKPQLNPMLKSMQVWELENVDAQRMALSILEAIGRQSWIPALQLKKTEKLGEDPSSLSALAGSMLGLFLSPIFYLGFAALVFWALNGVLVNWIKTIPVAYDFHDLLLVALILLVGGGIMENSQKKTG